MVATNGKPQCSIFQYFIPSAALLEECKWFSGVVFIIGERQGYPDPHHLPGLGCDKGFLSQPTPQFQIPVLFYGMQLTPGLQVRNSLSNFGVMGLL